MTIVTGIELGDRVKSRITGFEGIATSKIEYINGCVQYAVTPMVKRDDPGKWQDAVYLDWQSLDVVLPNAVHMRDQTVASNRGGPGSHEAKAPSSYKG